MRTITATGHIDLPKATTYRPPKPKRTGLDWGQVVNPDIWAKAAGIETCTHPECDRPAVTARYCSRHKSYEAAAERIRRAEEAHPPCINCGGPMRRRNGDSYASFAARKYCSADCRWDKKTVNCTHCGKTFTPTKTERTCSPECRAARGGKRHTGCTITNCDRPHYSRGLCNAHYQQARKAQR